MIDLTKRKYDLKRMLNVIKIMFKELFYEIPKSVYNNGAWDRIDHTYSDYTGTHYHRIEHYLALLILNIFSLFDIEIGIYRIIFLLAAIKQLFKGAVI